MTPTSMSLVDRVNGDPRLAEAPLDALAASAAGVTATEALGSVTLDANAAAIAGAALIERAID